MDRHNPPLLALAFRSGKWLLRVKILDVRMLNGIRWKPMK